MPTTYKQNMGRCNKFTSCVFCNKFTSLEVRRSCWFGSKEFLLHRLNHLFCKRSLLWFWPRTGKRTLRRTYWPRIFIQHQNHNVRSNRKISSVLSHANSCKPQIQGTPLAARGPIKNAMVGSHGIQLGSRRVFGKQHNRVLRVVRHRLRLQKF